MSGDPGIEFENEIREFLFNIGFADVPSWGEDRETLELGGQEIDAFGRLRDLYLVVDAKMSTSPSTSASGSQSQLTLISGYKERVENDIRTSYSQHGFKKCIFIYWTKNKKLPPDRIQFANDENIALRDETDLQYYNDALDILENQDIVRNSFLKDISLQLNEELFTVGLDIVVPAIRTHSGEKTFFSFQLPANMLFNLAYVFRLETNNLNILYSYQRLLNKDKIRSIRAYLNDAGYFANNILMVSDLNLEFTPLPGQENRDSAMGNLILPNKACFLEIIDGQHRLLAYSNMEEISNNHIGITVIHELSQKERAQLFVTVNKQQTRVKSSLLWLLYPRTDPDSKESKISLLAQKLNKVDPLKDLIKIPGMRSPFSYLSFTQLCNALYTRTNIYQEYGENESFFNVLTCYLTSIKNGNELITFDWNLSNEKKARKGFICSNTGIVTLIFLLKEILNARNELDIEFPSNENLTLWNTYLRNHIVPAIVEYLNENSNIAESPDDPYGYLRGETSILGRSEITSKIFEKVTVFS